VAQSRGVGHRCSLVIPERVLNEYTEDLIFLTRMTLNNEHPYSSVKKLRMAVSLSSL